MKRRLTRLRFSVHAAALVLSLAVAVTCAWAAPCEATIKGTQSPDRPSKDHVDKVFRVELTSRAECSKVYIDFVTTETLFDGERITLTHRGARGTSGSSTTSYQFIYPMALDSTLESWEFKVIRCVPCGTE